MDFTFTEDQMLFQASVREFLTNEVTTERIRASWESDSDAAMNGGASWLNWG